ncbi:argininosuccinate synthase [Ferrimonas balearica DSM 9799]|uniref:Argininosuccinate synthase n=1 Tax=Ferrimonas balearica (strain DSM 9799 / CCM 4581 / KCTC 23876 / PAT) TaxID=550540 RepID=E1SMH2_FERBD|nr:argininosuccinate synthase [Ferrimonas balearica]ADN74527.1 argininosuccinate synthase [Ferrimonas balearica DSM 9799]MBW3140340.1 argininosuccinate synthase [Ferrimonas balearica]MBW3165667.1 argininosuccinate synthase [Ferrimonas balearica]MBY6107845.1 argininosuccinate synthase [Ferrimonas balearica]MBY6225853.1 argininosuccinate synthase [Ferrimonas balearica]
MTQIKKVVLAYSGGLDTSAIIPWLKEQHDCEVVAFVADVGQGAEELEGVEAKAIASGASSCHVVDLKDAFVSEYINPILKTGALYEGTYLLGTAMARPIIAKAQVELALKVGADALAHGCTGKGNDQVRFESTYAALAPELSVIAPWREWTMKSRTDLLNYLASKNIPTTASAEKIYSRDANAWHISHEGGELEDPYCEPSEQVWTWTQSLEQAPNEAQYVSLQFEAGVLTAVDGESMTPYNALNYLNGVAAKHGVGRIDIVENRLVGMKSRGCYETPGGTVINNALRGLETLVLDKAAFKFREQIGLEFSHVLYDGRWFTPVAQAQLAAAESLAQALTGEIVVKLYKGHATVVKRQSPNSLYSEAFSTFEEDEVYNQKHAEGFIRLFSLSSRIAAMHKEQN